MEFKVAMDILFLTDNFPPESLGCANRVYERACYWVKWGHNVTVITSAPNFPEGKLYPGYKNKFYQSENIDGIRVIRVKTYIAPNKGVFRRIADFMSYMMSSFLFGLFQKKPDVIIATSPQFFTAVSGWALSIFKRVPFVFELGDIWPASISAVGAMKKSVLLSMLEKLELFLYRHSNAVIALTHAFKQNLIARGISADKIHVVLNGFDQSRIQKTAKEQQLLKQYDLQDSFIVGYIGTHGMAHALENVLHAAQLLLHEPRIKFMFVGAGARKENLVELAKQSELTNVCFIPSQPKTSIHRFWSLCDVALVHLKNELTFTEVIPSKIFEAMGMALPIVLASPKGEASELLESERAGLWVPAEEPEKLAEAIHQLYQNTELLQQLSCNSHSAAPHYSRELQAQKMLNVLETLKKLPHTPPQTAKPGRSDPERPSQIFHKNNQ